MKERPWYKRYPSNFIGGTVMMNLEQKGAYSILIDLIFDHGGPVPDDPQWIARVCGCSTRKWKSIRQTLIDMGKIIAQDGMITQPKAEEMAISGSKNARKLAENGAKGGLKSAEKRHESGEVNDLASKGLPKKSKHIRGQRTESSVANATDPGGSSDFVERKPPNEEPANPDDAWRYWNKGKPWLAKKIGCTEATAGKHLGKWIRSLNGDAVACLRLLNETRAKQTGDPVAYMTAAVKSHLERQVATSDRKKRDRTPGEGITMDEALNFKQGEQTA